METLAQFLALPYAAPSEGPARRLEALTGKSFSQAVLSSPEFRAYIVDGLNLRTLPPQVLCRLMDHGWGKPVERLEVKGVSDPLEDFTAEQCEDRALRLLEVARQLRAQQDMQKDEAESNQASVH